MLQLLHEDYPFTHASLCVAMYSFIQLSDLWQRGVNEIAQEYWNCNERIRTGILLIDSPMF